MDQLEIDRNLLFGVLALQRDMIDQSRFAEACAVWSLDIKRDLSDILIEHGWLDRGDRCEIERDIERKLRKYRGDVRATLGALAGPDFRDAIRAVDHIEVHKSLNGLPPAAGRVLVETLVKPTEQRSRYTLTRLYAEGGLGKVWVARDGDLNREVALKEIRPDQAQYPEMWQRFLKEAQITGQLEHPNIVPVYELARRCEDDQPFYTMRLVRGRTLSQAISDYHQRRGEGRVDPLALPKLLQAFIGVCQAIAYAHSRGVVHRDLKPDNVVLGGFGEVIVLDWGLATVLDRLDREDALPVVNLTDEANAEATRAGRQLGTPAYMAPEQAAGRLELVDGRTDVYGLGAILFEILTGHPPHEARNSLEIFERIINGEIPRARRFEPAAPKALEAICFRAMAKDRSDRYETAAILAEDVQRWLADEPISSYREPTLQRVARWARRHRAGMLAWGVTLLLIVASAIGGFYLEGKRTRQALAHRTQLSLASRSDEALARAEIHTDRFGSAELVLDQAVERLQGEPALVALLAHLEADRGQLHHLVEFRRIADEAEYLEVLNFDDEAEAACEAALRHLNITAHESWWEHLPATHLLDRRQVVQLQEEAYRLIILLAGIRAKDGLMNFGSSAAAGAYRRALDLLPAAQRFRPRDLSGRLLDLICRHGLGQPVQPIPAGDPESAVDYYFLGILHVLVADIPDDPVSKLFTSRTRKLSGLDFKNPLDTAQRYLRAAANRMPEHYWTHYWLGIALDVDKKPEEAELAYNTCVGLRPASASGYADRAVILIFQFTYTNDPKVGHLLLDRGMRDIQRATELDPNDPRVLTRRTRIFRLLAQPREMVEAAARLFDLWVYRHHGTAWSRNYARKQRDGLVQELVELTKSGCDNAETWSTIASAYLANDRLDEADRAVERALEHQDDHPRALAVRGTVALRRKLPRPDQAIADFDAALARSPGNYLAATGRAQAYESLENLGKALSGFDYALRVGVLDWQRREAQQGRARILRRLGRTEEASRAERIARDFIRMLPDSGVSSPRNGPSA